MNDPGLEEPITHAATEACASFASHENDTNGEKTSPRQDEALHTVAAKTQSMPTRWWYASTAFPLIAGTFGPLANAFSICALVQNWRSSVPPGGSQADGVDIPDPRFLIAINAVSLVCALIANLSLLLNMTKRLRFEIAQPITILGFFVASILLIGLLAFASTRAFHAPSVQNQVLTQAYYYGIFAAVQYQIITYLMCVTVWGAYQGAYAKDFELNAAQRTLMLQTIMFFVYLLVGAFIYNRIEGWKFLDAVYWMDFTLLTVGIGDFAPSTHLGRGLLFPIALGGIITVGLVVSSIRALILDRGAEQISNRVMEKTRQQVIRQVASRYRNQKSLHGILLTRENDRIKDLELTPAKNGPEELKRRKTEFQVMRNVQEMADRQRKYVALSISVLAFAILWFVGAVVFWRSEQEQGWTYFEALYFCYTSILTIGYGDIYPESNSGKAFFVYWSLLAVPTLTILISNMGDTVVKGVKDATIWLGEISVLPSTDASTRERLQRGVYRLTFGRIGSLDDEEEMDAKEEHGGTEKDEWSDYRDTHPGLVQLFDVSELNRIRRKDLTSLAHILKGWRQSHPDAETVDRSSPDELRKQATHHYRHLLISLIPRIYADTKLATPKKYSYWEWAIYLRLLGENESDSGKHGVPHIKAPSHRANQQEPVSESLTADHGADSDLRSNNPNNTTPWSWIGRHSPLMQSTSEAEWILKRLFHKLDESLKLERYSSRCSDEKFYR